jgi:8-oxo-dGTP pyrophosphatase MutT (NUDIX family)
MPEPVLAEAESVNPLSAQADADAGLAPIEDEPTSTPLNSSALRMQGYVWDVRQDSFDYNGTEIVRDYVDHPGAVAVLAIDDQDRVLLIQQYRHPVRMREWELPAGLLDVDGEHAYIGAQRELAEETDVVAAEWNVLTEFYTSPGGSNEVIRIYLARGLTPAPAAFDRTDEEADMVVRWVALDDCIDAILARKVQNPSLVVGVLAAAASRARGWASLGPADLAWPRHPRNWDHTV